MKDNYEKVLLVVGALVAVALLVLAVLKLTKVEEDFVPANERNLGAEPILFESEIEKAIATLANPETLEQKTTRNGRAVDTFTGVALFVRKGEDETVDLEDPKTPPVHPPIPNSWWLKYGVDPGFADSPQQDADEDGFSNKEEFDAKTDPSDSDSFPSLFAKVQVASLKKEPWLMTFSNFGAAGLSFKVKGLQDGAVVQNRIKGGGAVSVGETFYPDAPYQNRFKYLELVKKDVRGIPKDFAKVEDQKPGLKGRVYEFQNNNKEPVTDYTATLYLDTPDERDNTFQVEEGMSFSLPFDEAATEKPYRFEKVNGDGQSITLTWTVDGETKEMQLDVPAEP